MAYGLVWTWLASPPPQAWHVSRRGQRCAWRFHGALIDQRDLHAPVCLGKPHFQCADPKNQA